MKKAVSIEEKLFNLRKKMYRDITRGCLEGIKAIEPKLHRIILFGPYNYQELTERLGALKVLPKPEGRRPNYQGMASKQWKGIKGGLTIFYNQKEGKKQSACMIELTAPKNEPKEPLKRLMKKLPELKISKREYAIDIIVYRPIDARVIFNCLWKSLCPLHQREASCKGGQRIIYGKKIDIITSQNIELIDNRLARLGNGFKIYERGNDSDKNERGIWNHEHLNRVRIELTVKREFDKNNKSSKSKVKKPDTLEDLIKEGPKFTQTMTPKIRLIRAKESSKALPKEWEGYKTEDEYGNIGSIFIEHRQAYKRYGRTIYQQEEKAPDFEKLSEAIKLMLEWYDNNWFNPTPLPFDSYEDFMPSGELYYIKNVHKN